MEQDNEFWPDGMVVGIDEERGLVRLKFTKDSGEHQSLVIPRGALPFFAKEIQKQIEPASATPIRPDMMPLGTPMRLAATQVTARQGGGARLELTVEIPTGARTIPIDLPPSELSYIMTELGRFA